MDPALSSFLLPALLVFGVAILYSSVGHGGASGYLVVLSLLAVQPEAMVTSALILNMVVSSIAFVVFWRSGYFSWRKIWPFMTLSIPASFLGATLHISLSVYQLLLGFALVGAALRLAIRFQRDTEAGDYIQPPLSPSLLIGAGIGFLSGLVGIGGGIFLSPLMLLCRWANPKEVAACSALFILVNSLAGLSGKLLHGANLTAVPVTLLFAAIAGGLIGTSVSAKAVPMAALRRVLALVLLVAAAKLLYTAW